MARELYRDFKTGKIITFENFKQQLEEKGFTLETYDALKKEYNQKFGKQRKTKIIEVDGKEKRVKKTRLELKKERKENNPFSYAKKTLEKWEKELRKENIASYDYEFAVEFINSFGGKIYFNSKKVSRNEAINKIYEIIDFPIPIIYFMFTCKISKNRFKIYCEMNYIKKIKSSIKKDTLEIEYGTRYEDRYGSSFAFSSNN